MLTSASVDIDFSGSDGALSLPQVADSPEEEDNGEGEVRLEEALDRAHTGLTGASNNGRIELELMVSATGTNMETFHGGLPEQS